RKAIAGASLVAAPGCYPAGAVLATAPLLKRGLARLEGIVIDGKSGVTGAGAQGRKVEPMYLYTEANENVQAYGVASHRHTPEIEQELGALAGAPVRVSFTPHLLPLNRGLFTTASVALTQALPTGALLDVYREFYAGEPFVRVLDEGERPATRAVVGSNYCDLTVVAGPCSGAVHLQPGQGRARARLDGARARRPGAGHPRLERLRQRLYGRAWHQGRARDDEARGRALADPREPRARGVHGRDRRAA